MWPAYTTRSQEETYGNKQAGLVSLPHGDFSMGTRPWTILITRGGCLVNCQGGKEPAWCLISSYCTKLSLQKILTHTHTHNQHANYMKGIQSWAMYASEQSICFWSLLAMNQAGRIAGSRTRVPEVSTVQMPLPLCPALAPERVHSLWLCVLKLRVRAEFPTGLGARFGMV